MPSDLNRINLCFELLDILLPCLVSELEDAMCNTDNAPQVEDDEKTNTAVTVKEDLEGKGGYYYNKVEDIAGVREEDTRTQGD